MPFLSKDWRSPGEKWVRYDGGWEMKKTVWATQHGRTKSGSSGSGCDSDSGCELNEANQECGSWSSNGSFLNEEPKNKSENVLFHTLPIKLRAKVLFDNNASTHASSAPTRPPNAAQKILYTAKSQWLRFNEDNLRQPYFNIMLKSTREIKGFNALAEALLRLDFMNAVKDIRRFNYVSKIVYMLFSHDKLNQVGM